MQVALDGGGVQKGEWCCHLNNIIYGDNSTSKFIWILSLKTREKDLHSLDVLLSLRLVFTHICLSFVRVKDKILQVVNESKFDKMIEIENVTATDVCKGH